MAKTSNNPRADQDAWILKVLGIDLARLRAAPDGASSPTESPEAEIRDSLQESLVNIFLMIPDDTTDNAQSQAWRKRADAAEAALEASRPEAASLIHDLDNDIAASAAAARRQESPSLSRWQMVAEECQRQVTLLKPALMQNILDSGQAARLPAFGDSWSAFEAELDELVGVVTEALEDDAALTAAPNKVLSTLAMAKGLLNGSRFVRDVDSTTVMTVTVAQMLRDELDALSQALKGAAS